jgi:Caspase domain
MLRALAAALLLAAPGLALGGRFAVIAGNDRGDPARPRLWFAEKDAERMHRALAQLGDLDPGGTVLLLGKGPSALTAALHDLEPRIRSAKAAGERTLLVVYYSGHAGSGGLEMGAEKLSFEALRTALSASAADAKVAIVDACEAGLLTQVKGAAAAPALEFELPPDDVVSGMALIASTAVGESAQESAALGGSFFTHHLEVAVRGAADTDADGRVTLTEAFRYTSARTSAGTSGTVVGPQHPTYAFRMSGRGDVVLADLRRAEARLVVPPDPGATFILKTTSFHAEVPGAVQETTLALPAGPYRVERRGRDGRAVAEITLASGRTSTLPSLVPTRYEVARSKGGPKPGLLYAGAGVFSVGLPGFGVAPAGRIGVRKELGPIGYRFRLDLAKKSVTDQDLVYDYTYTGGALAALYPLNVGRVLVEAGVEGGYGWASQRLRDRRSFEAGVASAGGALLATAPVWRLRVGVDASAGAQVFNLNEGRVVRPAFSAAVLALWGF